MKRLFLPIILVLTAVASYGQNVDVRVEGRTVYNSFSEKGNYLDESGFKTDRFSLAIDGAINDKFSFAIFQHLNRHISSADMMEGTDWAYIQYQPNEHWEFKGGKIISAYGSWEYDASPIDIYFYSKQINLYRYFLPGIEAGYIFNGGADRIEGQITKSTWCENGINNLHSYNLRWRGHHGIFTGLYSFNAMTKPDRKLEYTLALGNKFSFDRFIITLDLCERFDQNRSIMDSWYATCKVRYMLNDKLDLSIKGSYDHDYPDFGNNNNRHSYDQSHFGGAVEYYPLDGSKDIRLHIQGNYIPETRLAVISAGLKWNVHIFKH